MKTIVRLITLAAWPLCGGLMLQGQDVPVPPASSQPQQVAPAPPTPRPPRASGVAAGRMGGYGSASTPVFTERLRNIIRPGGPAPAPTWLIIRSSAMAPKEQANLGEDLAIMSHILDKAVEEWSGHGSATAMGIDVFGEQTPAGNRAYYLEDYGALFTLHVGIPLVAAKPAPEEKTEQQPPNSTWEEAKRELLGQAPNSPPRPPDKQFIAEYVNRLTDALVNALRNASNIRALKPDDAVTVCILGSPAAPAPVRQTVNTGTRRFEVMTSPPPSAYEAATGPQKDTVLTIRITKSDAEALANGSLKPEEFRKRARIERYEDGPIAGAPMGFGGGFSGGIGGFGGGVGGFGGGGKF